MLPKFLIDLRPEIYLDGHYAGIDFETTNLNKGRATNPNNRLVGWVGIDGKGNDVHKEYYERDFRDYPSLLSFVDASRIDFFVAHNAKFELQWLYKLGLKPGSVLVWDTMIAEYVIAGNRKWDLDLDSTAKRYGLKGKESLVKAMIANGVCPSLIPETRLMDYCQTDVELTLAVFRKQLKIMRRLKLLPVMYTRCLTTLCLSEIETRGMHVDAPKVKKEYTKVEKEVRDVLAQLATITGGINPRSHKQVAGFLYDTLGFPEPQDYRGNVLRTPAGSRKTDEDTILGLKPTTGPQHGFIDAFQAFIPIKKRLETLTKLNQCANNEQILLANFNQCVTRSHRLSSSGHSYKIQFQNIDRDYKRLFIPRSPGWSIGDSDAPQLEFRVAADLGADAQAKLDIRNKFDVHSYTASILLDKPQEMVRKRERTNAKPDTFKPLYGGKSGTPAQKRYYAAFQEKYKALQKVQENWTYQVLKDKEIRIASGLIFYWPDIEVYQSGYIKHSTEIYNYPVQSFATADIIPITLIYMWYLMRDMDSFIVNTVHDSIIAELAPGEEEKWKQICRDTYTTYVFEYLKKVYNYTFTTPLGVSYNIGSYWGDGDEELFEVDPEEP